MLNKWLLSTPTAYLTDEEADHLMGALSPGNAHHRWLWNDERPKVSKPLVSPWNSTVAPGKNTPRRCEEEDMRAITVVQEESALPWRKPWQRKTTLSSTTTQGPREREC